MRPPVSADRVEALEKTIRSLKADLAAALERQKQLMQDAVQKDGFISFLRGEVSQAKEAEKEMYARLKVAEATLISESQKEAVTAIVDEVLQDFPGVTFAQVVAERGIGPLIAARRACLLAVYHRRPDLTWPRLARIFQRDHSTIIRTLQRLGIDAKRGGNRNG